MALSRGSGPSDYIEPLLEESIEKEGKLMSDYELLSIVLMVLAIVVTLVVALNAKK